MKIEHGCTRYVFLTKKYAIKIPQFRYGWRLFLHGLLANQQEVLFSTLKDERMCPVLFHIPGGWMLVMPRCTPLTEEEFYNLDIYKFWERDDIQWPGPDYKKAIVPVENKEDSFGWYNNKIVAIDYGN